MVPALWNWWSSEEETGTKPFLTKVKLCDRNWLKGGQRTPKGWDGGLTRHGCGGEHETWCEHNIVEGMGPRRWRRVEMWRECHSPRARRVGQEGVRLHLPHPRRRHVAILHPCPQSNMKSDLSTGLTTSDVLSLKRWSWQCEDRRAGGDVDWPTAIVWARGNTILEQGCRSRDGGKWADWRKI